MAFAEKTSVPVDRSKAEIDSLLRKYGADQIASSWEASGARLGFRMNGRAILFHLPLPGEDDPQEIRRRWRALVLILKGKLVAATTGITTFEEEFLAHIVTEDGRTVSEHVIPRLKNGSINGALLLSERAEAESASPRKNSEESDDEREPCS